MYIIIIAMTFIASCLALIFLPHKNMWRLPSFLFLVTMGSFVVFYAGLSALAQHDKDIHSSVTASQTQSAER